MSVTLRMIYKGQDNYKNLKWYVQEVGETKTFTKCKTIYDTLRQDIDTWVPVYYEDNIEHPYCTLRTRAFSRTIFKEGNKYEIEVSFKKTALREDRAKKGGSQLLKTIREKFWMNNQDEAITREGLRLHGVEYREEWKATVSYR